MNIKSTFIRKRGNNYNVYIEYIDENGKSKQRSEARYTNKKDAEKHLIEIKNSINNNKYIISNDITFVDRYKNYIYDKTRNLSPYTLQKRESYIRVNIEPFFKTIKLKEVTPAFLQSFINYMYTNYAKSSAGPIVGSVKSVLNECYRLKEINENPCNFIKTPKSNKKGYMTYDPYNSEEIKLIVNKLKGTSIEVPILLMLTAGLRCGEVCALRWSDIDFEKKTLSVNQTLLYTTKEKISFKEPKTEGSIRTISIPDELISKLKKLKIKNNEYRLNNILKYEDIICLNDNLMPYINSTLRNKWKRFTKNNNLRYIRLHDLRHTHATMLVLAGVDFKTISNRLGHTDIKITLNRYSHVLKEMDRKASDSISSLMFGNSQ